MPGVDSRRSLRSVVVFVILTLGVGFCIFWFGFTLMLGLSVLVGGVLLGIGVIDYDTREIPDRLIVALVPLAVLAVWVWPDVGLVSRIIGFFVISAPLLGMALWIEGAFGGGDIKLTAVCGFLLGWPNMLFGFFVAVVLAGGWAVYLLASGKGKRGQHMAFGPALCAGIFTAMVIGDGVVGWYTNFLVIGVAYA